MFTDKFLKRLQSLPDELATDQFWLASDVFSLDTYSSLVAAFDKKRPALRLARIGKGHLKNKIPEIRNDYITWLDASEVHFEPAWKLLDIIFRDLKKELFLPVKRYEVQLALYPPKHFYKRHVDRHKTFPARLITMVFYFNDWQLGDEGELVIYGKDNAKTMIQPKANSLVVFVSDLEHEVLPTKKDRKSLTAWFRDDIE